MMDNTTSLQSPWLRAAAIGSLVLLGAALLISQLWRRHARQEEELERAGERLEKLVGHFPGMALLCEPEFRPMWLTRRF